MAQTQPYKTPDPVDLKHRPFQCWENIVLYFQGKTTNERAWNFCDDAIKGAFEPFPFEPTVGATYGPKIQKNGNYEKCTLFPGEDGCPELPNEFKSNPEIGDWIVDGDWNPGRVIKTKYGPMGIDIIDVMSWDSGSFVGPFYITEWHPIRFRDIKTCLGIDIPDAENQETFEAANGKVSWGKSTGNPVYALAAPQNGTTVIINNIDKAISSFGAPQKKCPRISCPDYCGVSQIAMVEFTAEHSCPKCGFPGFIPRNDVCDHKKLRVGYDGSVRCLSEGCNAQWKFVLSGDKKLWPNLVLYRLTQKSKNIPIGLERDHFLCQPALKDLETTDVFVLEPKNSEAKAPPEGYKWPEVDNDIPF